MAIPKRTRALALALATALLASAAVAQMKPIGFGSVMAAVEGLDPGEYIWVPEVAPRGPMLVVVNIATQRLVAYRNGVPIAVSTVSTGKPGHNTPTGVFTILQKAKFHRSTIYSNAPMPFMQRLTWRGVAMHGGSLPGYPASHGCVRLPHEFARLLFGETALGMTVVVVNQPPALRVGPTAEGVRIGRTRALQGPAFWRPDLSPTGPVSIVVSGADRRMIVLRNGIEIGSAPVDYHGVIARAQAYVLTDVTDGDYRWERLALPGDADSVSLGAAETEAGQFQGTDAFRQAMASAVGPGTTMVVIPDSLGESIGALPQPIQLFEDDMVTAQWRADGQVTGGR